MTELMSSTEILTVFPTWNAGLVAAGLEPVPGDISVEDSDGGVLVAYPISDKGLAFLSTFTHAEKRGDSSTFWIKRVRRTIFTQEAEAQSLDVEWAKN